MTSKSQRIRDYRKKHPDSSAKDVAQALQEHGVTQSYVHTVVYNDKSKSRKSTSLDPIEKLKAARDFIASVGGVDNAIEAIESFVELTSIDV